MKECKIVSRKFAIEGSHTLEVAKHHNAYRSLEKRGEFTPTQMIKIIKDANLRGKGGGGASAGEKWELMPQDGDKPSFLAVNCDESEPGTFKDRQIITYDPHLLIEGIILTCYAIKSKHAYIYIRGEYKEYQDILQNAIDEAYEDGLLESCDITIHRGAGAYICGEKSALLESMEGKRGHPRLKPKQKEPEWFFGNPTLVNNVETIATVPFIIQNGSDAYREYGTHCSPGTLLFGMSGHVNKPGVYESEFGVSMLEYIEHFGGGVKNGKKLKAVIPGGVSCGVLTARECKDLTLDYEAMRTAGSSLGTGGMIIMDEDTDMVAVLKNILEFYHEESCGQCTPCREGTGWSDKILQKIVNKRGTKKDLEKLFELADVMNGKTICVFAPSVSSVLISFITKFRDEFERAVS
ncbi:NADH-quinone oxidoreductase subunit NuoF [uncultured Sulfurimonas sp.]|jgi:NADH-quinone oxidoreductase subunit F|uniref:NADH-quinone oxidoreductase subunit NuoF n=1 Tax=uncultured Sulfurimonas sp. TaxID=291845 RepID=UPI0032B1F207